MNTLPVSSQAVEGDAIGVYYHRDAQLGVGRRFAIHVIDFALLGGVWGLLSGFGEAFEWPRLLPLGLIWLIAWLYLAALKTTSLGTLGYRLLDAKLVNLQGGRVALWRATLRFFLVAPMPAYAIFDVLWAVGDVNRQTLRDKIAATYVVRSRAQPIGVGRISYPSYFVGGMALVIPEVPRPEAEHATRAEKTS